MHLILVRHGEINSNLAKVYSGRSNEALNTTGWAQAEAVADKLAGVKVDALYSSPLLRTVQTATLIANRLALKVDISAAFNEIGMGPWEGLSEAEVEARYPAEFTQWNTQPADLRLAGRETLKELQERALTGVAKAFDSHSTILVVTHVAVIRVLLLHAEGRPLNDYKSISVANAMPIQIEFKSA